MPNFSCLHTSYPFSSQGRIGTSFYPEGGVSVCCCCAWPLRFLLMLCCLWVNLQFPSCQMSCWLHGPVVCSAYLPAAGLKPSLTRCTNAQLGHEHLHCSLHTFGHNIYNCTWPWSIALFQINDHTMYFLGFCSFLFCSQNCSCAQTPGKGSVVELFMGALNSQQLHWYWACNQSCTQSFSQHWHLCPSDSQGAPHVPQLPWMSHAIASNALGLSSPAGQMCSWVAGWGHSN